MAGLHGRKSKALQGIRKVAKGVNLPPTVESPHKDDPSKHTVRRPVATGTTAATGRKSTNFVELVLTGSQGQTYTVAVPQYYATGVPKVWEWNEERYRVAELVAQGVPLSHIPDYPDVTIKSRMTIYFWLEHPEFKEHIDGLIMETGWANRRERLNNLKRLNDIVFNKVAKDIEGMKLTDKNVGALLSAIQAGAKLIAQEKGEFVEESKVSTDMSVTGSMVNVEAKLDDFVKSKSAEEQEELKKLFDKTGDDIIRAITGSKD